MTAVERTAPSYRFEPDERLRDAVRRCAREQLEQAESCLTAGIADDPVDAVHTARKAVKKERALLRLVRRAVPGSELRRENAALRDAARLVSGARDAEVTVDALDDLAERFAGQLPKRAFADLRRYLVSERDSTRAQLVGSSTPRRAAEQLSLVRLRVSGWDLRREEWAGIGDGLLRTYRRGRKAFRRAEADPSVENLHAWRKRVKDLWYQLRLVAPAGGEAVQGQAKEAHGLADLLGDDHDLAVLREIVVRRLGNATPEGDSVLALIDHRRDQLQREAMFVGARVYTEPPKAFRRRIRRAWHSGRAQADASRASDPRQLSAATRSAGTGT